MYIYILISSLSLDRGARSMASFATNDRSNSVLPIQTLLTGFTKASGRLEKLFQGMNAITAHDSRRHLLHFLGETNIPTFTLTCSVQLDDGNRDRRPRSRVSSFRVSSTCVFRSTSSSSSSSQRTRLDN